jgi:predicted metalloprotease with PDZ domain
MRKGEPGTSDKGLDQTHTWASTYWGGALYCMMADIKIRQETANRKGLQDALQAVLAAGGTIDQDWPIEKALAVGDKATGTTVLTTLYSTMGENSKTVDLDALWKELGVGVENGVVVLDNNAPLARIRERITTPALRAAAK